MTVRGQQGALTNRVTSGPSAVREARSARKQNREDTAAFLAVSTYREPVERVVIDDEQTTYCQRVLEDGNWMSRDAMCGDKISRKTITAPSDYITVKVEPTASQIAIAGMGEGSADRKRERK